MKDLKTGLYYVPERNYMVYIERITSRKYRDQTRISQNGKLKKVLAVTYQADIELKEQSFQNIELEQIQALRYIGKV